MFICKYCSNERKNGNSLRNHERLCNLNPLKQTTPFQNVDFQKTMNRDNQYTKAKKLGLPAPEPSEKQKFPNFLGRKHTKEAREKISKALTVNNKGGKCQWYDVDGIKVQGTYERDFVVELNKRNILWEKLKTHKHTFEYLHNGIIKRYTPDFYIPHLNLYVEIKGRWWGDGEEKFKCVLDQYPNLNIIIMFQNDLKLFLNGEKDLTSRN